MHYIRNGVGSSSMAFSVSHYFCLAAESFPIILFAPPGGDRGMDYDTIGENSGYSRRFGNDGSSGTWNNRCSARWRASSDVTLLLIVGLSLSASIDVVRIGGCTMIATLPSVCA